MKEGQPKMVEGSQAVKVDETSFVARSSMEAITVNEGGIQQNATVGSAPPLQSAKVTDPQSVGHVEGNGRTENSPREIVQSTKDDVQQVASKIVVQQVASKIVDIEKDLHQLLDSAETLSTAEAFETINVERIVDSREVVAVSEPDRGEKSTASELSDSAPKTRRDTIGPETKLGRFAISKADSTVPASKPDGDSQALVGLKPNLEPISTQEPATVRTEIHKNGQKSPEIHATVVYEEDHIKLVRAESKVTAASLLEQKGSGKNGQVTTSNDKGPSVIASDPVTYPVEGGGTEQAVMGRFQVKPAVVNESKDATEDSKDGAESRPKAERKVSLEATLGTPSQAAAVRESENRKLPLTKTKSVEDKTVPKLNDSSRGTSHAHKSEPAIPGKSSGTVARPPGGEKSQNNGRGHPLFRVGSGEEDEVVSNQKTPSESPRKCLSPTSDYQRYNSFEMTDPQVLSTSEHTCFSYSADSCSDRSVPPDVVSDTSSIASSGLNSPAVTPSLTPSSSFENLLNFDTPKASRPAQSGSQAGVTYERSLSLNSVSIHHIKNKSTLNCVTEQQLMRSLMPK